MASESSLRLRRSLIWETKEISWNQKDSPSFYLMDSNWILQINPVYGTGKFPTSYHIKLKKCSGAQSFQPFEVVTFLLDRRSNTKMFCSKLVVTNTCETLFKASFDSTYEKLPGLKMYDDITVACTFYPSTGLALSTKVVKGSSLRIRHSVVWRTGKPTACESKESPLFNLKSSKWRLELHLINNTQCRSSLYQICLRNTSGTQSFQPFDIETFFVDRKNFVHLWCSRLTVSFISEILYNGSIDSIYEALPGLKFSGEITILCEFGPPIGSALNEKMENDIAVDIECSHEQNQSICLQGTGADVSSSNSSSLIYSSDFENLSKEFGFLLDNSLMPDIELKSGEDSIPAHKVVLAARSKVFSEIFKTEMTEKNTVIFEIKDVEPLVLREFLRFLYCGKISTHLPEDMLCKLYTASDNYSVQSLRKLCANYMSRNLNAENFIKFLILADTHNDQELIDNVTAFITTKPGLLMSDIWTKFSEEFPRQANEIYRLHMMRALKISPAK